MSKKIAVYRIEHTESKLGPFTHANQISEVINKGVHASLNVMQDIDSLPEVQAILKQYPHALFAFSTPEKCQRFIKDKSILKKHGFVMAQYHVHPLYISEDDQIIYCNN